MDTIAASESLQFREDLEGRIANLALSPSYANTMIPIFETIMNSLHAIHDIYSEKWDKNGKLCVEIEHNDEGHPNSFLVIDNGIGLDDENFSSFLTYDSRQKIQKGGKGVGRLTWLKVFERVKVDSIFKNETKYYRRSFLFELDNVSPIKNHRVEEISKPHSVGTRIKLSHLKPGYRVYCPKKIETVAHYIIAHFLPSLIGKNFPEILVKNDVIEISLVDTISQNTFNPKVEKFNVEDVGEFEIRHLLIDKSLVERGVEHSIFLSAHDRIVFDHGINNQTGINVPIDVKGRKALYIGIVTGLVFDSNVTQERNNFDIPKSTMRKITKSAEDRSKEYLSDPIMKIIQKKTMTVERVISNFPRYGYLVKNKSDFARKLPLNSQSEEDIYREMSVYDYRANREVKGKLRDFIKKEDSTDMAIGFEKNLEELMDKLGEQERASLAEYVSKRKLIIDILESKFGFENDDSEKKYTEAAIHKIICPMKVNSGKVEYGEHNLWLIDDRLAYYDFWASDQKIRSYAKKSDAGGQPDIILFNGSHLLQRAGTNQPVVIIEFKRPARKEYTDDENPVKQIYDYIRDLRDNVINDNNGNLITEIGHNTPFFCYLVCDVTAKLLQILEDYEISQPLPGGRGYFGFNKSRGAYIEVLQYSRLVQDARLRHEAYFKTLGIN